MSLSDEILAIPCPAHEQQYGTWHRALSAAAALAKQREGELQAEVERLRHLADCVRIPEEGVPEHQWLTLGVHAVVELRKDCADLQRQLGEAKEIKRRLQETVDGLGHRLYSSRAIWTDTVDQKTLDRAQAEADEHQVPVSINVHGRNAATVRPKELSALSSRLAAAEQERDRLHRIAVSPQDGPSVDKIIAEVQALGNKTPEARRAIDAMRTLYAFHAACDKLAEFRNEIIPALRQANVKLRGLLEECLPYIQMCSNRGFVDSDEVLNRLTTALAEPEKPE